MILSLQLVAWKGIYGNTLSRVVDVRLGQESVTHDPSASTSPDNAVGTEMFSASSMNSASGAAGECLMNARLLISVVDDDQSVREALPELLKELGFAARIFSSAEEFLVSDAGLHSSCLLLDVGMPGMSGPELLRELRRRDLMVPVVFITARRDEAARSQMLNEGAVECLFKPFDDRALLQALNKAIGSKWMF
jgi:CheY-like chemotaxis protein